MLEDPYHLYDEEEARAERHWLTRIVIAVIVGLVIVGALASMLARAEATETVPIPVYVYEQDGTTIRLMPGPCVDAVSKVTIMRGAPQHLERFKAIESVWPMKDGTKRAFAGCWAELAAGEIGIPEDKAGRDERVLLLLFADGQGFAMKKRDFQKTGNWA